ncbi:MAG: hypothetical protein H0Z37_08235 [Firmicutes bacterium]|nr:hypothetical protein [Bacillota bacterium]
MSILLVTNGHGEDRLAVCLAEALGRVWPWAELEAVPLVGEGRTLSEAGLAVPGPRVTVPSGGLVRPELPVVWRDLRSGLIRQFRRQMDFVRRRARAAERVIAVGDTFAGWVAGRAAAGRPMVLVATAKSSYIHGHSRLECSWMRRRCQHVFARDEKTAADLCRAGVPASWEGNLMMDALEPPGEPLAAPGDEPVVALLPGSRSDAYVNLRALAAVLARLGDLLGPVLGLVPLAAGLDRDRAARVLTESGFRPGSRSLSESACDPALAPAAGDHNRPPVSGHVRELVLGSARIRVVEGRFGDVIRSADIVVGLAGTANEQAAGLGKPVVAFVGPGVQFGPRFLRAQKRLLGEALAVAPAEPDGAAAEVAAILTDPGRRARMAAAGRKRMGPPGAAARIARAIARLWRGEAEARCP